MYLFVHVCVRVCVFDVLFDSNYFTWCLRAKFFVMSEGLITFLVYAWYDNVNLFVCTADCAAYLNCCLIHVTCGCVQTTINDVKYCDWLVQYILLGGMDLIILKELVCYWHLRSVAVSCVVLFRSLGCKCSAGICRLRATVLALFYHGCSCRLRNNSVCYFISFCAVCVYLCK